MGIMGIGASDQYPAQSEASLMTPDWAGSVAAYWYGSSIDADTGLPEVLDEDGYPHTTAYDDPYFTGTGLLGSDS